MPHVALCPYFEKCGGCDLQHLNDAEYINVKNNILLQPLQQLNIADKVTDPIIIGAGKRRRASFKINYSQHKIQFGFFQRRSHQVVDINQCLILKPEIEALIEPLKNLVRLITSSEIFVTLSDGGLDLLFVIKNKLNLNLEKKLIEFSIEFAIARINVKMGNKIYPVIEHRKIYSKLGNYQVMLPPQAFIQATKESEQALINLVMQYIKPKQNIIDLYAGCGTYSYPMSEIAKVTAIEGEVAMVNAIKSSNINAFKRDLFKQPLTSQELNNFDVAVINPPRNGAIRQVEELAASKVKTVIMISCNIETFIRDAKILLSAGFSLEQACVIDQFYYSWHIEIFARFKKLKGK